MPTHFVDAEVAKSKVDSQFMVVSDFANMELHRDLLDRVVGLGWKIADEYATLSSDAEA